MLADLQAGVRGECAITLEQLIEAVEGAVLTGDGSIEIENIEYDSRLVKPNSLFFAVKGYRVDGYDFVRQAKENGAVAVMGEREGCDEIGIHVRVPDIRAAMAKCAAAFYEYPGHKIKSCGVTGTNGKTTTCFMIKSILEARAKRTGLITSLVYDTGKDKFKAERTTPESLDVQRLLFLMKRNWCVNAVIEVSSHALVLHRVDEINFRVAVYTNFTRDHLDFHKTMDAYLEAKALLLHKLEGPMSYVVINLDVPEFRRLLPEIKSAHISYAVEDTSADVRCEAYELRADGTTFDLKTPLGTRTIELHLPGRFNLTNAVAAAAGGLASGADLDSVVRGLEAVRPIPGRFNHVSAGQPFAVYIDYAHTPDAIERLCKSARELCDGRLLLLFGCGGDRDTGKRPLMGKAAMDFADFAVVTSDNPRSERPSAIIDAIRPALDDDRSAVVEDRREAICTILKMARSGDAVLLAGKGAETYQEVAGVRHPFEDRLVALDALASMGFTGSESEES
ncbi:MAG: UDP-N-acetylmuramoyl-L-alanyl-D-glutamate--2,6-diaminopimelate ligase [candidate division Zixibacteria bacterium]|jgi:UDP-N-acetylmuramoyl-L-alanyl-D-glutamate--2,6-diaminopimelate ligase|nr:UDP-N-acetylmuramoyl-L-alanyl-D-glutamate--2,6-diaminopimelate ligase [candidate division Zixibacteria bacterium]